MSIEAKLYLHGYGETKWVSNDFAYFGEIYAVANKDTGAENPLTYCAHIDDVSPDHEDIIKSLGISEEDYFDNEDEYYMEYRKQHLIGKIHDANEVYDSVKSIIAYFKGSSRDEYSLDNKKISKQYIITDLELLLKDLQFALDNHYKVRIELG